MDEDFKVRDYKFFESVINSDERFTYQEAEDILEAKPKNFLVRVCIYYSN